MMSLVVRLTSVKENR
uniref:Uncharacterized protein n=1 Tax=Arundo donax TaxID=35708 RepID=A0A0A9A8K9_ARUDO